MPHTAILIAEKSWISARVIDAWLQAGNRIAEVWCFEPECALLGPPKGLFGRLFPAWDVSLLLARHHVPVRLHQPLKNWDKARDRVLEVGADVLMTLMTRQIVPASLIGHFGGRAINVHPAMLPHYKGPSPRVGMLLDGKADEAGGVTLHVLSPGIDEGPIIARRAVPRSQARHDQHWDALQAVAAADLAAGALLDYLDGRLEAAPQAPGSGNYRRVPLSELAIGPAVDAERARWLCETLGDADALHCAGPGGKSVPVVGFDRHLGPPTGAAPRSGPGFVEIDVRDARLRLRRRTPLWKAAAWARKVDAVRRAGETSGD
ncbi:MAG: formyltransferase family protein [Mesorhizobium sp.]